MLLGEIVTLVMFLIFTFQVIEGTLALRTAAFLSLLAIRSDMLGHGKPLKSTGAPASVAGSKLLLTSYVRGG